MPVMKMTNRRIRNCLLEGSLLLVIRKFYRQKIRYKNVDSKEYACKIVDFG